MQGEYELNSPRKMSFSLLQLLTALSWRNVFRNPRRTTLTLLALSAGVWSAVTLSALARGVSEGMARDAIRGLTGHVQIHALGYVNNPSRDLSFELKLPLEQALGSSPISAWTQRVRLSGVVASERESSGVTIVGIDPQKESAISFIGDGLSAGEFFNDGGDGVVVGKKLLENLQTSIGKRVVLMTQGQANKISDRGFRIIGVFDSLLESRETSFVFISLSRAKELAQIGPAISEVSLITSRISESENVALDMQSKFPELEVTHWTKLEPLVVSLRQIQDGFLKLWFVIVVFAISFGLINTLFMSIFERIREFGLMEALGLRKSSVVSLVMLESSLLIVVGMFVGNSLSAITVWSLSGGIDISQFAKGAATAGISSVIYPTMMLSDALIANALVLIIGLVASAYPAYKASRHNPIDAMGRS